MASFNELYCRLNVETAFLFFVKKNNEFRSMVATRNLETAKLVSEISADNLYSHDVNVKSDSTVISVIDLEIGELRSFSCDRLLYSEFFGEVKDIEQLKGILNKAKYLDMSCVNSILH